MKAERKPAASPRVRTLADLADVVGEPPCSGLAARSTSPSESSRRVARWLLGGLRETKVEITATRANSLAHELERLAGAVRE